MNYYSSVARGGPSSIGIILFQKSDDYKFYSVFFFILEIKNKMLKDTWALLLFRYSAGKCAKAHGLIQLRIGALIPSTFLIYCFVNLSPNHIKINKKLSRIHGLWTNRSSWSRGNVPSSHAREQQFKPRRRQYFKLLLDPGYFSLQP